MPRIAKVTHSQATMPTTVSRQACDAAAGRIAARFDRQPAAEARVRHTFGRLYLRSGAADEAVAMFDRAADVRRRELGPADPDTLRSVGGLADAQYACGRYADALALFERNFAARRGALGPDHRDTLRTMHEVGNCLRALGRHQDAVGWHVDAVAGQEARLDPADRDLCFGRGNLAAAYRETGRPADAYRIDAANVRALRACRRPGDPETLYAMADLAEDCDALGRTAEAAALRDEIVRGRAAVDPARPRFMAYLSVLAATYRATGRPADAAAVLDEAVGRSARPHRGLLYDAGRAHAVVAGLADQAGDAAVASTAAGVAMDYLRRAVAAGYADGPRLAADADADLAFLRGRADFRRLAAGLNPEPAPPPRRVTPGTGLGRSCRTRPGGTPAGSVTR